MSSLVSIDDYDGRLPPRPVQHRIDQNPNINPDLKLAVMDDPKPLPTGKKKRKTSVDGKTVQEVVDNIIKDEPNVTLVRKAFKKMAGFIEEKNEIAFEL